MTPSDRLDSWKEIAAYLKRGIRTVQRWEQVEKLPVHRLGPGSVHAYKTELDAWWQAQARRLSAEVELLDTSEPSPEPARWRPLVSMAAIGLSLVAVSALAAWRYFQPVPAVVAQPLTFDVGAEYAPTFSPNGEQVAYCCRAPRGLPDICIKSIGAATPRYLTRTEEPEGTPAWSPDGRSLAFARLLKNGRVGILLVPAGGGPEGLVTETDRGGVLGWSPDGRWILVWDQPVGMVAVAVSTGARQVLFAGGAKIPLPLASITPDLKRLLYPRLGAVGQIRLFEMKLGPGLKPEGKERPVTDAIWLDALAILPNGEEIVFAQNAGGEVGSLWRLKLEPSAKPVRILEGSGDYCGLAVSADGGRLAFCAQRRNRVEMWSHDLTGGRKPHALSLSTHSDLNPDWSPDGKSLAVHSTRTGRSDIWIVDAQAKGSRRLTNTNARTTATPRWSPNGEHIAFESIESGQWKVYVIRSAGGPAQVVTDHPSMNAFPSWSRDGRWLYFMSDRSGAREIWKVAFPAAGGPVRVTQGGGAVAVESRDGRHLYYTKTRDSGPLFRLDLAGGREPEEIVPVVRELFFAVGRQGIYYVASGREIRFWDAATGRIRPVLEVESGLNIGLALSPDERTLLFAQSERTDADLYWANLPVR